MTTAAQRARNAQRQAKYKRKQQAKAAAQARMEATQFAEGNTEGLMHGTQANPENLPAVYQTRFPAETSQDTLLSTLEDMTSGALTMLEWLEACDHLEAGEQVGPYQQIVNRLVKIRGEMEGGNQKATRFGKLTDERADRMKQELALALGYGLTKFKHTYSWLREHGLEDKDERFRRHAVKGLAGILAGSATTIETWSAIRQWEERKKHKVEDPIMGAYGKRTQG